jgi:NAD-dependent deacetylase
MCDRVPGEESAAALRKIIEKSRRIVFFGGAGVSTESGIPDFRSPEGLYAGDFEGLTPEMILSKSFFYLHPERFFAFYRKYMVYPDARPNAAHLKLYAWEQRDILRGIVTQNVDGLHKAAGNRRVYEIHGSVHDNACMDCGAFYPLRAVMEADGVPRCPQCGGVIKPSVVLYGEAPDKYVCMGARREISNADTLVVGGPSRGGGPPAGVRGFFIGQNQVVGDPGPPPPHSRASLVIRGSVAKVLGAI